jgi:hypothetical protein
VYTATPKHTLKDYSLSCGTAPVEIGKWLRRARPFPSRCPSTQAPCRRASDRVARLAEYYCGISDTYGDDPKLRADTSSADFWLVRTPRRTALLPMAKHALTHPARPQCFAYNVCIEHYRVTKNTLQMDLVSIPRPPPFVTSSAGVHKRTLRVELRRFITQPSCYGSDSFFCCSVARTTLLGSASPLPRMRW